MCFPCLLTSLIHLYPRILRDSSVTERSGGVSSGVSFCSGKSAPKLGEKTCAAAPLSTTIATAESVLRSVRVTDATNSSSTFTEETTCACCKVGACCCVYSCACCSGNHCWSYCHASCSFHCWQCGSYCCWLYCSSL